MMPYLRLVRASALALVLLALSAMPASRGESTASAALAPFDEQLAKTFTAETPGAAVLVVSKGEVLLRKAYGAANLELGVPLQPDHVLRLGSVTKQFTAVAVLQLVQAGKIRLEDDITTYVPEVETGGNKITLQHLLTHTSGLPSFTDQAAWRAVPRQDLTIAQQLAFIKGLPLKFPPGTKWEYSNTGYLLLGAVIEKVTGQTYAAYVAEKIFQPAGMVDSRYDEARRIIPRRVPGYSAGQRIPTLNAEYVSMTQPHAAGALLSTLDDLRKWDAALTAGTLLPAELLARAHASALLADGRTTGYGFGWSVGRIAGHHVVAHGGGIQGFNTYVLRAADAGLFVAILCNSDNPKASPGALALRIARKLLAAPDAPAGVELTAEQLASVTGVFRYSPTEKFELANESGRPAARDTGGRQMKLRALSPQEFTDPASDTTYVVRDRDASGRATRLILRQPFVADRWAVRVDEPLEDPAHPPFAVPIAVLDRYVGDYELAPNFVFTVKRDEDRLTGQATGQPMTNLIAESQTRFRVKQVAAIIEFKVDANGRATSLVLFQNGREMPAPRLP